MQVEFQLPTQRKTGPPCALTIGNFDGVHGGHRQLIDATTAAARSAGHEAVVVTFDPHPRCVLHPDDCPASITTLDEKCERLATLGIDRVCVINFTRDMSLLSASAFLQLLVEGLDVRRLTVGKDFAVGHNREGNVDFLRSFGTTHGFDVLVIDPVDDGSGPISSSRIRGALLDGDVPTANRLLGYRYFIDASVEHGAHLGRELGFPTANLSMTPNKCLPQRGVYTGWVGVDAVQHMAAINVGYRPTFGGDRLIVEAYLLDFDGDLYSQRVRVSFEERLREERAYPGAAELIEQMHRDVATTRERLSGGTPPRADG